MACISINYDGSDAKTYQSVSIMYGDLREKNTRQFDSGIFPIDWYNAKKFYLLHVHPSEPYLSKLSDCDHFFFDGANVLYDSAYMKMENDQPVLRYEKNADGWEFFVLNGTKPTWEELKEQSDEYWPKDLK